MNDVWLQEMMLNELVRHSASSSSGGSGDVPMKCLPSSCALNPGAQGMQSPCASGLDPFLGQVPAGVVESHVRQNSTDSGLGEFVSGMYTMGVFRGPSRVQNPRNESFPVK